MKRVMILSIIFVILLCGCGNISDEAKRRPVLKESGWNIYSYWETENGVSYTLNDYPVSDEEELKALLKKADSGLQAPEYIPDGYEFDSGSVSYFLTKDMLDRLAAEEKTGEDGRVLYEYILPDEVLDQIDGFHIIYKNKNGEEIIIYADYVKSMDIETGNDDFQETEAKNYQAARTGIWNENYTGEFFRNVNPVYEYAGNEEITLSCIFINISMSDTENEQVVKIAESM